MQADSTKAASDDLNASTNAERAYDVGSFMVKATAGVLAPVGGGVLAAAFDLIVTDPAIRRRDKFLTDVNERLTEMEQSGVIRAKDLEDSEEISSLLLKAVQTATRSSGKQKLEALKEIVVKGITAKEAASASQAQVMLALVDRITEYHIIALNWRSAPRRQYSPGQIRDNIPEGARQSLHYGQPVFVRTWWKRLTLSLFGSSEILLDNAHARCMDFYKPLFIIRFRIWQNLDVAPGIIIFQRPFNARS